MAKINEMFLEAVEAYAGTNDVNSIEYQDALSMLEGKNSEKKEYLQNMVDDISKWSKSSEKRNQEIYDTKGDITKFDPDIKDVIDSLQNSVGSGVMLMDGGTGGQANSVRLQYMNVIRSLYAHFTIHKKLYMDAFKTGNKTAQQVYVAGTWLLISYTSAICSAFMVGANSLFRGKQLKNADMKYGDMIQSFHKVITHPKYVQYLDTAESSSLNTEGILYEGAIAIGGAIVALVMTLRLITWNIYMMRTKLSDKLKVSAEFLEKNAKRIGNTDRKNAQKIAERQKLASIQLNKMGEKLRIKLDEDEYTKPPKPDKPTQKNDSKNDTSSDDDDMDIEL